MTLNYKNGIKLIPVAAISDGQVKPGYLFCCREGMDGRFSFSVPELIKAGNPPELVKAYMENLSGNFQKWLEKQTSEYGNYSEKKPYQWQEGDLPPFWFPPEGHPDGFFAPDNFVEQPKDTRKESDYATYGDEEPVRAPRRTSRRKKA